MYRCMYISLSLSLYQTSSGCSLWTSVAGILLVSPLNIIYIYIYIYIYIHMYAYVPLPCTEGPLN